jgi:hypothetical protein
MRVLAHMNTARWGNMSTADREEAIQCPCQCGIQNVEHVLTGECVYVLVYIDEMIDSVDYALCSETEAAQSKWMAARNVEEKVVAVIGMETRGVSPDALSEVASALKLLVRRAETALRTGNKAGWIAWRYGHRAVTGRRWSSRLIWCRKTNGWWRPDSHSSMRRRAHGEQHVHTSTQHTHTPASFDAPSAATGNDRLHSRRDHGTVEGRKRAPPVQ